MKLRVLCAHVATDGQRYDEGDYYEEANKTYAEARIDAKICELATEKVIKRAKADKDAEADEVAAKQLADEQAAKEAAEKAAADALLS